MSSSISIKVESLSKCYQIYESPRDRLKQYILPQFQRLAGWESRKYFREFWALRDLDFEVQKGQTVGILGRNGAGKSTLLQILCGTLTPTTGSVDIKGRVAALLELGAGFSPEFTGQENVYMNGQLLGLGKDYLDDKIDEIREFADIGDFFYQPVKTYSSGMFARLAFSVAIHVEPDILVVDEALSVGDSWFQHKSIDRMKRLMSNGCTVLFVSHSIESVRAICERAIWLEEGKAKLYGDSRTVTNQYMNEVFIEHNRITLASDVNQEKDRNDLQSEETSENRVLKDKGGCESASQNLDGSAALKVTRTSIINSEGFEVDSLRQGEKFTIAVFIDFLRDVQDISVGFVLKDQFGQELTGESLFNTYKKSMDFSKGESIKVHFSSQMMFRGGQSYSVSLRINQVSKWDRSDNVLIYADDIAVVIDVVSDLDNPMWFKFRQHFDVEVICD